MSVIFLTGFILERCLAGLSQFGKKMVHKINVAMSNGVLKKTPRIRNIFLKKSIREHH